MHFLTNRMAILNRISTSLYTLFSILLFSILSILLIACQNPKSGENEIIIGTIAGPETELMQTVKKVADEKYHLKVRIVEYEDYVTPNSALADGSIDANLFQHKPYLDKAIQAKGYPIVDIGRVFIYPMGLYSKRHQSLDQIPDHGTVGIPVDPSNGGRALLLLQQAKLISLNPAAGLYPTVKDITDNPKHLVIKEMDAAVLPRILEDVDLAAVNTNFAIPAGLSPHQHALILENKDSPYANIVVVRKDEANQAKFKKLMEALHSKEVTEQAEKLFSNQAIPAW